MSKYFISDFRYTRYRITWYRTFDISNFPIYRITLYRTFDISNNLISNFRDIELLYKFRYIEILCIELSVYRIIYIELSIHRIALYRTFDISNFFISNNRYIVLLYIELSIYHIELIFPSILSLGIHPRVFNADFERKFESHQNVRDYIDSFFVLIVWYRIGYDSDIDINIQHQLQHKLTSQELVPWFWGQTTWN